MSRKKDTKIRRRVIALLTREEMEYLEKLALDAHFSSGKKLSRVEILSALVEAARELQISGEGIKSKRELIDRVINSVRLQPERRKYPRIKKELVAGFRKAESLANHVNAISKDVGCEGVKIEVRELPEGFEAGQTVEISLKVNPEMNPISALGRIAWISPNLEEGGFEIGVKLVHIKPEDRKTFEEFIKKEEASEHVRVRPCLPEGD